ncbi:hypothetical protein [Clostridium estertheticum]|uniref:Uncharacterized protein n=1 Tax=Clostridium estertheticum TaxID=238834 RepID=A0AA47ELP6_9CLOT|nr:hypothetical protein [Clostridium estertheticum]MBU3153882.1 hypothetical protein [Clostridium estertheticum]WAG61341.1 hypothetical protein LL038_03550 [Clostridium estertheticum]
MISTIISFLYPILSVGISVGIVPFVIKLLIARLGSVNLAKNEKLASKIWDALEEDGRMGIVTDKLTSFITTMQKRTKLSDEDILLLNKSLAGIANAGKEAVVKEASEVVPTIIEPKFVDAEGTEYVKKVVPVTAV